MASRWRGCLLTAAAAAVGAASMAGCAHGRARTVDPTAAAEQVCAGVAPLAVLVGPLAPETAVARGQALYCLGLYQPALAVLTQQAIRKPVDETIADAMASTSASPEPPPLAADRLPALRWLVYLHRRFPGWERIIAAVGEVARADLDRPEVADVRDDLFALAARFEYQRGSFDKTLDLLRKIPASSPRHLHALLLEGATHVRRALAAPALAAFTEALRIAPAGADRDLAAISLAGVYYAMKQFPAASALYDRLPPPSPQWARAALEGAWASLHMKDYPRALARTQMLAGRSGVPAATMAEVFTLEATIALYNCREGDFQQALKRFNDVYPALFTEAKRRSLQAPDALFEVAASLRSGQVPPSALDAVAIRESLADVPVARRFDELDELERERTLYLTLDSGWRASTPQGLDIGNELATRRSTVRREAGEQLQRRLKLLADALATQIKQTIRIEGDAASTTPGVPSDQDAWSLCRPAP